MSDEAKPLTDEERARRIIDHAHFQHWHEPDFIEALVEHEKTIAADRERIEAADLLLLDALLDTHAFCWCGEIAPHTCLGCRIRAYRKRYKKEDDDE